VQWLPLGWVDVAMIGVIAVSAIVGMVRGLTFELLSLAGWFVAYFAGRWFAPFLAPHLPIGAAGSALNQGASFVSAFLIVLIVWSLLARGVSALIGATPLRPLDRLLGSLFGLARGLLVLLAVATVVVYTPLAGSAAWRASAGAVLLDGVLHALLPIVPAGWAPAWRRV
jgi:membrane protein required for colicin V production